MGHNYIWHFISCFCVGILRGNKLHMLLVIVVSFKSTWTDVDCTLIGDGWSRKAKTMIDFVCFVIIIFSSV